MQRRSNAGGCQRLFGALVLLALVAASVVSGASLLKGAAARSAEGEQVITDGLPGETLSIQEMEETITATQPAANTVSPQSLSTHTPVPSITATATQLPLLEGPMVIGYSIEGRPLEVHRIGTGPLAFMVVAGIHGGYEVNTVQLADELISYFYQHPDQVPEGTRLYILRAMNMDGLYKPDDADGRANARQVDLNRNFPADWQVDWRRTGCWDYREINAGEMPASEPETIALMAFVLEHPLVALISYHSAAPGFYPSGSPPHADSAALAKHLAAASGYPYPARRTGCQMTGTLVDWVHANGTAAVDVELSNHWDTEFEANLKLVMALLQWRP